jgi:hypothetical protein
MNRDQYLAKRMWLCGAAGSAATAAKVLPTLLGGNEAMSGLAQDAKPLLPGPALGGPAGTGHLPGKVSPVELPI